MRGKRNGLLFSLCAASLIAVPLSAGLTACNNTPVVTEDYVTEWKVVAINGNESSENPTALEGQVGDYITLTASSTKSKNNDSSFKGKFSFSTDNEDVASVNSKGVVSLNGEGSAVITIKCTNFDPNGTNTPKKINITVSKVQVATGVQSFAADSYYDKLQVLGKLENYAINNHLTGLTLFENGGKTVYSKRISFPTSSYIAGYGFGVLSDGDLLNNGGKNLDKDGNEVTNVWTVDGVDYSDYYHTAFGSGVTNLCYLDDQGSVTADLYGYISTSLYGTQLNSSKNGYQWTGLLAKNYDDLVNKSLIKYEGNKKGNPIPVKVSSSETDANGFINNNNITELDPTSGSGMFSSYKVYVKTGEDDEPNEKLRYATSSTNEQISAFNNRAVSIDDYITAYKNLLTKRNGYYRGSEMTSLTSSGTLKNALSYYQASANGYNEKAWENVGIKKGKDANGYYIVYTLVSPLTPFYAKYSVGGNLTSPIPQSFLNIMAGGIENGDPKAYLKGGETGNGVKFENVADTALSLGAYTVKVFDPTGSRKSIVFEKNSNYQVVEPGKYNKIPGVYMTYLDSSTNVNAYVDEFKAGHLDAAGLTQSTLNDIFNNGVRKTTVGDSTFKLNINSCTPEMWEKLFGENGTVYKNSTANYWRKAGDASTEKPWMSNDNFLNGISFAIDRKTYAENRGNNPSINYFSDSYQWDPEGDEASSHGYSVSYNATPNHTDTLKELYGDEYETDYGYDKEAAIQLFKKAVEEMKNKGEITLPCNAEIQIQWMNTGDEKEYGVDLKKMIESAANDPAVSNGQFKLTVTNVDGSSDYSKVYDLMRQGQFDLAFGSISGNTLNPLEFLEVLKSDNSSSFTLNYGTDTSIPSSELEYNGSCWSYDSLWTAAVKGAIIDDAGIVNSSPVTVNSRSSKVSGENTIYTILVDVVNTSVIKLTNESAIATISYKEKASDTSYVSYDMIIEESNFNISNDQKTLTITLPNSFDTTTSSDNKPITINSDKYYSVEVMINYEVNIETSKGLVSSTSSFTIRIA